MPGKSADYELIKEYEGKAEALKYESHDQYIAQKRALIKEFVNKALQSQ
jgi:hypothetical protein